MKAPVCAVITPPKIKLKCLYAVQEMMLMLNIRSSRLGFTGLLVTTNIFYFWLYIFSKLFYLM